MQPTLVKKRIQTNILTYLCHYFHFHMHIQTNIKDDIKDTLLSSSPSALLYTVVNNILQAGTELGQVQIELGLGFTLK